MKSFLSVAVIALSFALGASAQELKWKFPAPQPSFPFDAGPYFQEFANDGTGGSAWLFGYSSKSGEGAGQRLVWLSKTGKQKFAVDLPADPTKYIRLFRVTSGAVYCHVVTHTYGTLNSVLIRRYRIVRGVLQTTDTALDVALYGAFSNLGPQILDPFGFFSGQSENDVFIEVRRYSN